MASDKAKKSTVTDEDDDENEDGGVWFYVNKGGFPVDEFTWNRMYKHAQKLNPNNPAIMDLKKTMNKLPDVSIPQAPVSFPLNTVVDDRLKIIQKYMLDLQYNHTGTQFFEIKKNRPISGLMESAKEIIKESLPIKCLEAVILGLYLTSGTPALDRFPISFKTTFSGNTYRHVVLGVYSLGRYGALGMSRREDLMYKPLIYKSLSDLVLDFKRSYEKYWHSVQKVKIGCTVPHDPHSFEQINWKQYSFSPLKLRKEELSRELDHCAREIKSQVRPPTSAHNSSPQQSNRKSTHTVSKSTGDTKHSAKKDRKKQSPIVDQSSVQKHTQAVNSSHTTDPVLKKLDTSSYQMRI